MPSHTFRTHLPGRTQGRQQNPGIASCPPRRTLAPRNPDQVRPAFRSPWPRAPTPWKKRVETETTRHLHTIQQILIQTEILEESREGPSAFLRLEQLTEELPLFPSTLPTSCRRVPPNEEPYFLAADPVEACLCPNFDWRLLETPTRTGTRRETTRCGQARKRTRCSCLEL